MGKSPPSEAERRMERRARALRANLKRRKAAQSAARTAERAAGPQEPDGPPPAGPED